MVMRPLMISLEIRMNSGVIASVVMHGDNQLAIAGCMHPERIVRGAAQTEDPINLLQLQ